ncbi:MAG: hypothetical protein LKH04_04925 [Lachnospiraceae bacterium]|jgi:uncharacterized membrane protein|nr:hypothetical protein [Lachnospiraceae bacterium]MCI1397668.1 hypothetical protein [Lachnospiraceae bacterium]MCI1423632.1 hypothetical protein [Lachnospiraceae bacterium]MCI1452437.1 hypothetical protein [Lachnospiraceae bacterium]
MACQKKTLLQEFLYYNSFNILSIIGLSVYILADTYFISSGVGTTGLTALNLALPVYSLVNGIGLMLGIWLAMPVTEALVLALGLVFLSRLSRAGNLMPAPDSISDSLTASCIFRLQYELCVL